MFAEIKKPKNNFSMKSFFCIVFVVLSPVFVRCSRGESIDFATMTSPILLRGDTRTAYRDPAVIYDDGVFHLFCTKVVVEEDNTVFSYTVQCRSKDLKRWTEPETITPRDQNLNYSSPGNVVRHGGSWLLCLQTYPRPGLIWKVDETPTFGNDQARLFIMRSSDLCHWSEPELLRVLGSDAPNEKMGRMIDPYLIEDRFEPGKWWCFFKSHGEIMYSQSSDFIHWTYCGKAAAGENPCVILHKNGYRLFYSPDNGICCKTSDDLLNWKEEGKPIYLGQDSWSWAQGRITAGFVLDLKNEPKVGKYLMFFHGSRGPNLGETTMNFDIDSHIGLAWSDDLESWFWAPGDTE